MTGLQTTKEACFDHQLGRCYGICVGKEDVKTYNKRVESAIESFTLQCGTYLSLAERESHGRRKHLSMSKAAFTKGMDLWTHLNQSNTIEDILDTIIPQKHNAEIQHILNAQQFQAVPATENIVQFATS